MLNKVVLHSCSSVTPLMSTEFLDVALIHVLESKEYSNYQRRISN